MNGQKGKFSTAVGGRNFTTTYSSKVVHNVQYSHLHDLKRVRIIFLIHLNDPQKLETNT